MARMLWNDRIGEEKKVNGYTFTIIDVIDKKVEVRVNGKNFIVSRDVWNRGVFKNIMNELCPKQEKSNKAPRVSKYVGDEKIISDVLFHVVEYVKGKVKVVADGYEGVKEMAISTWKNAKFFKNIMKVLVKKSNLLPMIYNSCQRNFIGKIHSSVFERMENEFDECMTKHEVRKVFKKYAKMFHPDSSKYVFDKFAWSVLVGNRDIALACVEMFED